MISSSPVAGKKHGRDQEDDSEGPSVKTQKTLSPGPTIDEKIVLQPAKPEQSNRLPFLPNKTYVQMVKVGRQKDREVVFGKPLAIDDETLWEAVDRAEGAVDSASDFLSSIHSEHGEELSAEEDSIAERSTRQLQDQVRLLCNTHSALQEVLANGQGIVYDAGRIQQLHQKVPNMCEDDRESQMTDTQKEAKDSVIDGMSALMDIFAQMEDENTVGDSETEGEGHPKTKIPSQPHAMISAGESYLRFCSSQDLPPTKCMCIAKMDRWTPKGTRNVTLYDPQTRAIIPCREVEQATLSSDRDIRTRESTVSSELFRFHRPPPPSEQASTTLISTVGAASLTDLPIRSRNHFSD